MVPLPPADEEQVVAVLLYDCVDRRHTFAQQRSLAAPLLLRQSTWCHTHDCPAVLVGAPVVADGRSGQRPG